MFERQGLVELVHRKDICLPPELLEKLVAAEEHIESLMVDDHFFTCETFQNLDGLLCRYMKLLNRFSFHKSVIRYLPLAQRATFCAVWRRSER